MIEFKNVSKVYKNNVKALSNVNLKIDKGEFVFLMGQSGAGKSTIIKMLIKEEEPTNGEIIIGGECLEEIRHRNIAHFRRKIGIVFQDFRLLPNKSIYENVAFALKVLELSPKTIRKKVPSILHSVGLSGKLKHYPNELSGGEQQRVAIARALVNNPPVLICDEPTGNLDSQTSMEIMDLISEINARGTTIIMATHAQDIVDKMKKRVIMLENGVVVRDTQVRRESTYES